MRWKEPGSGVNCYLTESCDFLQVGYARCGSGDTFAVRRSSCTVDMCIRLLISVLSKSPKQLVDCFVFLFCFLTIVLKPKHIKNEKH